METNKITPKVSMYEFDNQLTKAMQGDKKAIAFIDSLTINRADGMGFDMFSKESFWSDSISRSSSICAIVTPIYTRYKAFRRSQENEIGNIYKNFSE
jgi:hypothetical protein